MGSIGNGAPVEIEIVVEVRNDQGGQTVTNTATVDADTDDTDPADNVGTASTNITDTSGFYIVKDASPSLVIAGEQLTYTIKVGNEGGTDFPEVLDDLPSSVTLVSATPSQGTAPR